MIKVLIISENRQLVGKICTFLASCKKINIFITYFSIYAEHDIKELKPDFILLDHEILSSVDDLLSYICNNKINTIIMSSTPLDYDNNRTIVILKSDIFKIPTLINEFHYNSLNKKIPNDIIPFFDIFPYFLMLFSHCLNDDIYNLDKTIRTMEIEQDTIRKITIYFNIFYGLVVEMSNLNLVQTHVDFYTCENERDYLRYSFDNISAQLKNKKLSSHTLNCICYILNNYQNSISISDISDFIGISNAHLSKTVKRDLNLTVLDLLNTFRMSLAKIYLTSSKKNIKFISNSIGFKDPLYFSRHFKVKFGVSPSTFKKLSVNINESIS